MTPPSRASEPPVPRPGVHYYIGIALLTLIALCFVLTGVAGAAEPEAQWLKLESAAELKSKALESQKSAKERLESRKTLVESVESKIREAVTSWTEAAKESTTPAEKYHNHSLELESEARLAASESEYEYIREQLSNQTSEVYTLESGVDELESKVLRLKNETKGLSVVCREGCSTGSSEVQVSNFNSEAQTDLSEMKESLETVGWCVIGTLIACMLSFFMFSLIRPR